jgi:hypothetical protein
VHFVVIWWIMDKSERIALDLMTAGKAGREVADSLKLYRRDGLYLGGWSLRGLSDRIRKHLTGELESENLELHQLNEDAFVEFR